MKRIRTCLCDQFVSFHAHQHIGRFNTHNKIVISHFFDHMHFVKSTLHDPFCRYTVVFFQNMLFQRTAVHTDTDWYIVLFCLIYNSLNLFFRADISRIDPNLIRSVFDRGDRQPVIEMNICHKRNMNLFFYFFQRLCRFHCRNRTTNDFTSCRLQTQYLIYCFFHIFCLCICHRLDRYRMSSSDLHIADRNFFCVFPVHSVSPFSELSYRFIITEEFRKRNSSSSDLLLLLFSFDKYKLIAIFTLC